MPVTETVSDGHQTRIYPSAAEGINAICRARRWSKAVAVDEAVKHYLSTHGIKITDEDRIGDKRTRRPRE
jgi:hypothetical protein